MLNGNLCIYRTITFSQRFTPLRFWCQHLRRPIQAACRVGPECRVQVCPVS